MEQKTTAGERLAFIEERYFKGISLTDVVYWGPEEFNSFVRSQVERLLSETTDGHAPVAKSFAANYYASDELVKQAKFIMSLCVDGVLRISWEEFRVFTINIIASACRQLNEHENIYIGDMFDVKGAFSISNKELVEKLLTTPYEHIAMHTAYTLKLRTHEQYFDMWYQPAQDETAKIVSMEYKEFIRHPEETTIPPRAYTKAILDTLVRIDRHWQRGRRLKLDPEVIKLHDDIFGCVPRRFDKRVIEAAKVLYDYMDKNMRGRLCFKGKITSWDEMPESFRNNYDDVMGKMSQKVCEVRDQYLGGGWLKDHSLAFEYVMGQAENIGGYMTSGEDEE